MLVAVSLIQGGTVVVSENELRKTHQSQSGENVQSERQSRARGEYVQSEEAAEREG